MPFAASSLPNKGGSSIKVQSVVHANGHIYAFKSHSPAGNLKVNIRTTAILCTNGKRSFFVRPGTEFRPGR